VRAATPDLTLIWHCRIALKHGEADRRDPASSFFVDLSRKPDGDCYTVPFNRTLLKLGNKISFT
jgi:hypothetical protein